MKVTGYILCVSPDKFDLGLHDIDDFMREAAVTVGFSHDNVLAILGICLDNRDAYVILPYMAKGCLKDLLMDKENVSKMLVVALLR